MGGVLVFRAVAVLGAVVLVAGACANDEGDAGLDASRISNGAPTDECNWPQAGLGVEHPFATVCADAVSEADVDRLAEMWFFPTEAEVTGAPAVDDDRIYFGDWNGTVSAVERESGELDWSFETDVHPAVYAGQVTASPALATVDGTEAVIVSGGRTVYALSRGDGEELWRHELGDTDDDEDPTEIEGAPAVTEDHVVIGYDVHNSGDHRSGVVRLELKTGEEDWYWDPEEGGPSGGCGGVWGAPSVDTARGLVVVGTANCPDEDAWGPYAEAIVALDYETGEPLWSHQPHEPGNNQDWDFAGAPNLYEIDGRAVVGLGSKDGWYYAVDRETGELIWETEAQQQDTDGDGFAFGGFIGATAVSGGVVAGGTAIGDCPCVHAFDAGTGEVRWTNNEPSGTYAASAATDDLLFLGGVDQTLRAFRLDDGEIVWSTDLRAVSSSGVSIAGHELFVGVGFREPGTATPSATAGIQAFRVFGEDEDVPDVTTTTQADTGTAVIALEPVVHPCVGQPCALPTTLKDPPAGTEPSISLEIQPEPLNITVQASGLGPPAAWVREGSAAADAGATTYAVFISTRDDQPQTGSILCTFTEAEPGCSASQIDGRQDLYTRITLVAVEDASTPPSIQEGFDRLVTTQGFDPPLVPKP